MTPDELTLEQRAEAAQLAGDWRRSGMPRMLTADEACVLTDGAVTEPGSRLSVARALVTRVPLRDRIIPMSNPAH